MKFRLLEIPKEEKQIARTLGGDDIAKALQERDFKEGRFIEPIEVKVRLIRLGNQVFLNGIILGNFEATCSRCLELFNVPIKQKFNQTFLPYTQKLGQDNQELVTDDLDITYYSGEELDLSPIIWDELILGIPLNPLCRVDCRGLCPKCGANLNKENCSCPASPGNREWEQLQQLNFIKS